MDTSKKFEDLANNPEIYPPEFYMKFGTQSAHWELESPQKRERSLCHDMVCILLANMEPSSTLEDEMIKGLKRSRKEARGAPTKSLRIEESDELMEEAESQSDNETDYSSGEDRSDSDCDYDPEEEFKRTNQGILKYRYIVLEGLINAAEIQSHFTNLWQLGIMTKLYDIIDTKEKRLIEVKTTTNLPKILSEYANQSNTNDNTSLITVDMLELHIDIHNKEDAMPGESKAYNFLMKRKALMKTLGLEDRYYDEELLSKILFKGAYINNTIEMMNELYRENVLMEVGIKDIETEGFKIEPIETETMFEHLRKPLLECHEKHCEYKGKITPFFYCNPIILNDGKDIIAVDHIVTELWGNMQFIEGEPQLMVALESLLKNWIESSNETKNFGFIDLRDKKQREELCPNIKEAFMIGKKGKVNNNDIEDPKQKEGVKIENRGYPDWFEILYTDLSKRNGHGKCNMGTVETHSKVPLYRHLEEWNDKFYSEVGERNIGGLINQTSGFYSRVSGTYNTVIGNRTTHSSLAAIPIKVVLDNEEGVERLLTGVAFRGPHHMRAATDKSNLLIVERIGDFEDVLKSMYPRATKIMVGDQKYLIRKTAIKKIDGIHLTFVRNSLFIASNMIGDLLMRHSNFISEDAFKALSASHLTNEQSMNFFVDRVIDATLMAVIGNSRDEGYFAMFRKFFMILINRRRQSCSFTFDVKGMCDKLNECIVDNPLSMFFHNSLLYMICNY